MNERWAHRLHRFSGVALALFLPIHFWVLAQALNGPEALDRMLRLADRPTVKFAEAGLVFLLAVHVLGGARLIALEWFGWTPHQRPIAGAAVIGGLALAAAFALAAV